ncbi:MAG: hypothetical protein ACYC3E_00590 [Carboxydocellales bacterium]
MKETYKDENRAEFLRSDTMASVGDNSILQYWLLKQRRIEWFFTLGLSGRRKPNIKGSFITTLSYLDDQGEKWGDTYIKAVGQHFDDYAHWNAVRMFLPIGGSGFSRVLIPKPFVRRRYKGAAPGVTGLIGEVLITVFLQNVLRLHPFDMAHLKDSPRLPTPDLCLDIQPNSLANLFNTAIYIRSVFENSMIASDLNSMSWNQPLPIECKSRRDFGNRQARAALLQLLEYWRKVYLVI